MHKIAPNCTYIEENVHLTARELHEMYEEAFFKGYEAGQRDAQAQSLKPKNTRDFFYALMQKPRD